MKKLIMFIVILSMCSIANARDTRHLYSINDAMNSPVTSDKLDNSVKFYFGNQDHPRILQDFGTYYVNRKTNAFAKSDNKACNWVFLSAMKELQARAKKMGANAVVNIVSYYKKNEMSSLDQYECHAGGVVAGVALKGDFIKIKE